MADHTSKVVPAFDFTVAKKLPVAERFSISLDRARNIADFTGFAKYFDAPCVAPTGATELELGEMESRLGITLPEEYRQFLKICRYLNIGVGIEVGGFANDGVYVTESPWISDEHRAGTRYLVFANYWRYADGDQLMFDMTDPTHPVIAYLHEHGPLFEFYAPSFSLGLWRLVHEFENES